MTDTVGIREKAFRVDADNGRASWFGRTLVMDRVIAKCTDNAYSVVEQHAAPGYQSTYHINHGEKEIRYILEGELEIVTDGTRFQAKAGQTVVCKQGQPHGWRVSGDETARILVMYSPSGFEEIYHDAGDAANERRVPQATLGQNISKYANQYDLEILDQELPQE